MVLSHHLRTDLRLRTLLSSWGGLRRCHVLYGSRPHLLTKVGSSAATCWLRTSPPGWGGLRRCHVSYHSGLRFLAKVGSDAACILCLRTSPPSWGRIWRCHVSHSSLRATSFKHKEKSSRPACAGRHACSHCTHAYFQGASRQCHHVPVRRADR
jgi:hypothetical protein